MIIKFLEKNVLLSWIIVFVGAFLIFYISSLKFQGGAGGIGFIPILYHLFAFFFFGFFMLVSVVRGRKDFLLFFLGIIFSLIYAISDEIHQYFVPGRVAGLFDVGIDLIGIIFAMVVYLIVIFWRR